MATSKNNRKKGRKRQQMHSRPIPDYVAKAQAEQEKEEIKSMQRTQNISFFGLVIMIVGFVLVVMGYALIGYPVTFAGSLIGLLTTPQDMKHRKITIGGHIVYCIMVAFLWFSAIASL